MSVAPQAEGENTGSRPGLSIDEMALELATGLSLADVGVLRSDPSPDMRAQIAVKFAREFDRLTKAPDHKLTWDFLDFFSHDRSSLVRMRFAEALKSSWHLPLKTATHLARDEIEVAAPMLQASPVLNEDVLADIVRTMPEDYALQIAGRQPLSAGLADLLIQHRGTLRMATRLLDNDQADLSETALLSFRDWGRNHPDIADRVNNRPILPFALVSDRVTELAKKVRWPSLSDRMMTRHEATQLQQRFEGRASPRCSSKSERFDRLRRELKTSSEKGILDPSAMLAFLRDQDVDRLECAFTVKTGLDLRRVRRLLYGSDRRGLIALCLKAGFGAADYLAFRIAFGLAELGAAWEKPRMRYHDNMMMFAKEQFEQMRADPHLVKGWLRSSSA